MTVEITVAGLISFVYVSAVVSLFGYMDLKERRVPNRLMLLSMIIGLLLVIITGHLLEHLSVHIASIIIAVSFGIVLFRLKTIGGADAKALLTIAIASPGIEFGSLGPPIIEGLVGSLLPITVMLILGYVYYRRKDAADSKTTPLIPFLLLGFLAVQILAAL